MRKARLSGGRGDGTLIDYRGSAAVMVPFLCGSGLCQARYEPSGCGEDGVEVLAHISDEHRTDESALITLGYGLEHRVCQAFAATDQGKAWIEAHRERPCTSTKTTVAF